jgi:hypothetical protein
VSKVFETLEMAELTRAQASEKMQNIVDSQQNIDLKFGVLIGLIKVESVSNKEVVNTILHLVSTKPHPVNYLSRGDNFATTNCEKNHIRAVECR